MVVVCILFYVNSSPSSSQGINEKPDVPPEDTLTISPHYLSRLPYFPNNSEKRTKIFLEKATLSFTTDSKYYAYRGDYAVVINATIRNNYNIEETIRFSEEGSNEIRVGIDVQMYNEEGVFVGTIHRGNIIRGCYEASLMSGETVSFERVFVTPNWDIDYIEIYVSWLPDVPL